MSSNQSRNQFESWYQQHSGHSLYLEWHDQGFYLSPATGNLFAAWEASHEALLKKQDQEQEEFLAHLADYDHEDRFHG